MSSSLKLRFSQAIDGESGLCRYMESPYESSNEPPGPIRCDGNIDEPHIGRGGNTSLGTRLPFITALCPTFSSTRQWRNEGGQRGQPPPGAAPEGRKISFQWYTIL